MKGERAFEDPPEILLYRVLSDLQGEALQHPGEITELVQNHRQNQLGLVVEMVVERAFCDFCRARDIARGHATEPLRAQQPFGRADELFPLVGRRETGADAGCSRPRRLQLDRKSTRLNSSHRTISYAVFCLKKKKTKNNILDYDTRN